MPKVHASCTSSNRLVYPVGKQGVYRAGMPRLTLDRLLSVAESSRGWDRPKLTHELGASKQQIGNWKDRGVPTKEWAPIAKKLGVTVEQLIGGEQPRRRAAGVLLTVTQEDVDHLDESARDLVLQLITAIRSALRGAGGGPDVVAKR